MTAATARAIRRARCGIRLPALATGLIVLASAVLAQENEWLRREEAPAAAPKRTNQLPGAASPAGARAPQKAQPKPSEAIGPALAKPAAPSPARARAPTGERAAGTAAATAAQATLGTPAACDPGQPADEQLRLALQQHERAKIGFRYKFRRGVLPAKSPSDLVLTSRPAAVVLADVRAQMDRLSDEGLPTAALVYGETGCAFLVTAQGVDVFAQLPRAEGALATSIAAGVRSGLGLERRIAARSPRLRTQPPLRPAANGDEETAAEDEAARTSARERTAATLRAASQTLLPKALTDRLARKDIARLLILPSRDLGTVPFAALPIGEQALIDFVMPVMLADIEGLLPWERPQFKPTSGAKLMIGDPDLSADRTWVFQPLPGARLEVEQVSRLVGATPLLAAAATHDAVLRRLKAEQSRLSLIYFATHGIADGVNPMDASFLALKDGMFAAREIRSLKLERHPLVVMSACQSGLGKVFEGGVFGLARAWHYAGAAQVVMSLWSVDDEATRFLMTEFIKLTNLAPLPEAALQLAMRKTRERFPDPALWASFTLYGLPTRARFVD